MANKAKKRLAVTVTFSIVFAVLLLGTFAVIFFNGPTIYHFPSKYSIPLADWMGLIPQQATSFEAINVTAVKASSVAFNPAAAYFVNIQQTGQRIYFTNTQLVATYYLPTSNPQSNETEIIIFQTPTNVYEQLEQSLSNSSKIPKLTYAGYTLYFITNNDTLTRTVAQGVMVFYKEFILYTQSTPSPEGSMESALQLLIQSGQTLVQQNDVVRSLYAALQNRSNYLALFYQGHLTQIPNSIGGAKSVQVLNDHIIGTYAFEFSNLSAAKGEYKTVTFTYSNATSAYILDNYVVTTLIFSPQAAGAELQGF